MARRSTPKTSININTQTSRKNTQRDRLIAGIIEVANRDGYAGCSVSAVTAAAKVSKPTFYEYFQDRDDCFVAALEVVCMSLLEEILATIAQEPAEWAMTSAAATMARFASAEPLLARFLMNEPLAAGGPALEARDRGIGELAKAVEQALASAAADTLVPDVPIEIVIGGIYRLLASRLRRSEPITTALADSICEWLRSYEVTLEEHRWRSLRLWPKLEPSPYLPKTRLRPPDPLGPGRPRLSEPEVAENQRRRILFSTAHLAKEKGFSATTVAEIVKHAHVDLRAFYALFPEKQDAFMAVQELGLQDVIAVTALAFFAGASWPERSWEAGRALTQFLEMNPTLATIGFVEAYAVGPAAAQRIEDSHVAFTIFLREGLHHTSKADALSRVALEATVVSGFELVYRQVRSKRRAAVSGALPYIAYLWLTPFLGPQETNRFIDRNRPAARRSRSRSREGRSPSASK
jgi:AcrR family transcriptional regulator